MLELALFDRIVTFILLGYNKIQGSEGVLERKGGSSIRRLAVLNLVTMHQILEATVRLLNRDCGCRPVSNGGVDFSNLVTLAIGEGVEIQLFT